MEQIWHRWRTDDKAGRVMVKAEHAGPYYGRYGYTDAAGCGKTVAEKDCRYIGWMDHTKYILSGSNYCLGPLNHKRPYNDIRWPEGFDHTSRWRIHGKSFPLFVLTEPYHVSQEDRQNWSWVADENKLKFKVFEPGQKSLWVPDHTWMVFWWSPAYYEPDFDLLMGHQDWNEFQKSLEYTERELAPR